MLTALAFGMQRSKVREAHTQMPNESLWGWAVYSQVWDAVSFPERMTYEAVRVEFSQPRGAGVDSETSAEENLDGEADMA